MFQQINNWCTNKHYNFIVFHNDKTTMTRNYQTGPMHAQCTTFSRPNDKERKRDFDLDDWPLSAGETPLARHSPPNLLWKILLPSGVAVALFVISMPAACPSKMRLCRSTGWLWLLMSTPACALRKMSFFSRTPAHTHHSTRVCHSDITFSSCRSQISKTLGQVQTPKNQI